MLISVYLMIEMIFNGANGAHAAQPSRQFFVDLARELEPSTPCESRLEPELPDPLQRAIARGRRLFESPNVTLPPGTRFHGTSTEYVEFIRGHDGLIGGRASGYHIRSHRRLGSRSALFFFRAHRSVTVATMMSEAYNYTDFTSFGHFLVRNLDQSLCRIEAVPTELCDEPSTTWDEHRRTFDDDDPSAVAILEKLEALGERRRERLLALARARLGVVLVFDARAVRRTPVVVDTDYDVPSAGAFLFKDRMPLEVLYAVVPMNVGAAQRLEAIAGARQEQRRSANQ